MDLNILLNQTTNIEETPLKQTLKWMLDNNELVININGEIELLEKN